MPKPGDHLDGVLEGSLSNICSSTLGINICHLRFRPPVDRGPPRRVPNDLQQASLCLSKLLLRNSNSFRTQAWVEIGKNHIAVIALHQSKSSFVVAFSTGQITHRKRSRSQTIIRCCCPRPIFIWLVYES